MGDGKGNGYGARSSALFEYFGNFGGGPGDSVGNSREIPPSYGDGPEGQLDGNGEIPVKYGDGDEE